MNGGVKTALLLSGVALAGCSTANEGLKVRPIANPSAALSNGDALAVARGQFMLGNVGLALEAFRKAQRENPNNPDVVAGIGDCYAAMGRFDIAEASYEEALALAPRDHVLLLGLASVLERGGDLKRAADIRAEAARFQQIEALMAAQARARALAQAKAADEARQLAAASASVTVKVPPARPVKQARAAARAAKPAAQPAAPVQQAAVTPRAPVVARARAPLVPPVATSVPVPAPTVAVQPVKSQLASEPRVAVAALPKEAQPLTVTPRAAVVAAPVQSPLEAVRPAPPLVLPAAEVELQPSAARASLPLLALDERLASSLPASVPLSIPRPPAKEPPPVALPVKLAEPASPRLQRLSGGEVALVTTADASWRPQVPVRTAVRKAAAVQTASADSVRWIPLRLAAARPGVQVLNAARSQGLAASARGVLFGRGWREVGIGDATALRRTSVVFYPANRAALGRRLAAQFGVPAKLSEHQNVVLLLGRDSLDKIASQRRS